MLFSVVLLATLSPIVGAVPQGTNSYAPSRPLLSPPQACKPELTPGLYSKIRNGIIESIWRPEKQRVLSSSLSTPSEYREKYGKDVVLRFNITTPADVKALSRASDALGLDIWEANNEWADIRLAKERVPLLIAMLPPSLQKVHSPLIHDLAQSIFESFPTGDLDPRLWSPIDQSRGFTHVRCKVDELEGDGFFRDYQPLSVISAWMRYLTAVFPEYVEMISIGASYEGRDIPALRVGARQSDSEMPSKMILVSGGSHAREWIGTSTVTYLANSLINGYGKSSDIKKAVDEFDWVFIPTINPDGYAYTWEHDRLWRKNRQRTALPFCPGVDLDRAWGFEWDGDPSNPCSENFAGVGPFGGVESGRLADWARNETESNHAEFVAFLDFHSYSQQVLYPYSYSCTATPPLLENLEEAAMVLAKAVRQTHGHNYGVSAACEGDLTGSKKGKLFPRIRLGGGSALDWFYHELHVRYAYQIKLRDTGTYGFLLPKREIVPTGEETFNGLVELGKYLLSNKGIEMLEWPQTHTGPAKGSS